KLAKLLDGQGRLGVPAFLVGSTPSRDAGPTAAERELSSAFEDVCSGRRIAYVGAVSGLIGRELCECDRARAVADHTGQTGYGLIAWLVLHGGFGRWLGTSS